MSRKTRFEELLEPFQIRQVKLRNRMVKVATALSWANEDNSVSERQIAWYEVLAGGGVGMVTVEGANVDLPFGVLPRKRLLEISDDKFIPGLSKLAKVMHKYNCPTFSQIGHMGPAHPQAITSLQLVAAS